MKAGNEQADGLTDDKELERSFKLLLEHLNHCTLFQLETMHGKNYQK